MPKQLATKSKVDSYEDPSPGNFARQAILVAIVLIALGVLVFFLASAVAGGIIALLGSIFGLASRVIPE